MSGKEAWWIGFQIDPLVGTVSEVERFFRLWSKQEPSSRALDKSLDKQASEFISHGVKSAGIHFLDSDIAGPQDKVMHDLETIDTLISIKGINSLMPIKVKKHSLQEKTLQNIVFSIAVRIVDDTSHEPESGPVMEREEQKKMYFEQLLKFGISHASASANPSSERVREWRAIKDKLYGIKEDRLLDRLKSRIKSALTSVISEHERSGTGISDTMKMSRASRDPEISYKIISQQDTEVGTLVELRRKMQHLLGKGDRANGDVSIHRVRTHLFSAKSYTLANDDVELLIRSSIPERPEALLMLRTRFELLALQEIASMLRRASRCYKRITSQLESGDFLSVLENVAELFWLQRRAWQATHKDVVLDIASVIAFVKGDVSNLNDKPLQDLAKGDTTNTTPTQGSLSVITIWNAMCGHVPSPPMIGGGRGNMPATAPAVPEHVARSSMLMSVDKNRESVINLTRDTLKYASHVDKVSILSNGKQSEFATVILQPFLAPIMDQWEVNLQEYLKPMSILGDAHHDFDAAEGRIRQTSVTAATPSMIAKVTASLSGGNMMLLQAVKALRLFMQIGAAFVAQKVFNESYMRKVFTEGRDPPPLNRMLFLMVSIDATTHLLLVLILVLASFAFKSDGNTFIIDDLFLSDMMVEFAMSSTFLIILGSVVADIMRRKRYFQYADQGQVVSSAYQTALLSLCMVNFVVPFSLLIS